LRRSVTGLRAWLVQRVSAVYMLFFIVFLLIHFLVDPPTSYLAWHDWVLSRGVSVAASIFWLALLAHAWVGVRDVVMDYVHPVAVRGLMLALLGLGLTGFGAWVIRLLVPGHG
jgi:succinate dehydrogenase / fumarate reductase, membrane anchor subunit